MVAPNLAIKAQGTTLAYSDGGSPSAFTLVGGIRGVSDIGGGTAPVNDASTLDSTFKEKMLGLNDEGQMNVSFNGKPSNAVQVALRAARRAQSRLEWRVVFSDAAVAVFFGYIMNFSVSAERGGIVNGAMTIEIDGEVAWT